MSDTKKELGAVYANGHASQNKRQLYTVGRDIDSEQPGGSYLKDLPLYEGKNVLQILEDLKTAKGKKKIWDVGCGEGKFLLSLQKKFGDGFLYEGLTAYPYHDENQVQQAGVKIRIGDIQRSEVKDAYDVVVAEHALEYTENPLIALKRIYLALKPGGIALLQPVVLAFSTPAEENEFIEFLRNTYGFVITPGKVVPWGDETKRGWKFAFKKEADRLVFPVAIEKIVDISHEYLDLKQVQYRLRR